MVLTEGNWIIILLIYYIQRGEADVPLFETIKTNAGTQPKNELQQ